MKYIISNISANRCLIQILGNKRTSKGYMVIQEFILPNPRKSRRIGKGLVNVLTQGKYYGKVLKNPYETLKEGAIFIAEGYNFYKPNNIMWKSRKPVLEENKNFTLTKDIQRELKGGD